MAGLELDVDDGADDLDDFADSLVSHYLDLVARCVNARPKLAYSAWAPETTSMISLRDRRLTNLVHVQRERVDHLGGVLRGRVHRGHLRREERRVRLEQRAVDLHLDEPRQQLIEDLLRRRLVQVVDLRPRIAARLAPALPSRGHPRAESGAPDRRPPAATSPT